MIGVVLGLYECHVRGISRESDTVCLWTIVSYKVDGFQAYDHALGGIHGINLGTVGSLPWYT